MRICAADQCVLKLHHNGMLRLTTGRGSFGAEPTGPKGRGQVGQGEDMGQCVTKCKNPSSSLGCKSGDKESGGKAHSRKGGASVGGATAHREESGKAAGDPMANGTKKQETPERDREGDGKGEEQVSLWRLEELFSCYRDAQEDAILEEGMERFCCDLHLDPAEFRVLLLAWKFQAATMCRFTRKEFMEGCKALGVDSLEGIVSRLPSLIQEAQGEERFRDLYRFTFQFGLDAEEGQRALQRDIAIALWRLVFTLEPPPLLPCWLHFLVENPSGVKGISRDTWNMFLNFTQAIGPDLSNYSEDEAWPSLFDIFVEWEVERRKLAEKGGGDLQEGGWR